MLPQAEPGHNLLFHAHLSLGGDGGYIFRWGMFSHCLYTHMSVLTALGGAGAVCGCFATEIPFSSCMASVEHG